MFGLELHDIVPYLFSISLLYTFAYAYASHLNSGGPEFRESSLVIQIHTLALPEVVYRYVPARHWLARKVKRKEAPDDDITDCSTSFVTAFSNKRGGLEWRRTMYSLYQNTAGSSL